MIIHCGKECVESGEIVSHIKKAIDEEKYIILYMDYFYEKIRPDVFGKEHGKHTILIYGYDEHSKKFEIIEHKNKNSFIYEEQLIDYCDIEKDINHI